MLQNTLCVLQRWVRYSIARTDNEALPHARLRDRYPRNVPLLGGFIPRHVEHKGGWLHAVVHREPTIPDLTLIPPSLSVPLSLSLYLTLCEVPTAWTLLPRKKLLPQRKTFSLCLFFVFLEGMNPSLNYDVA